MLQEEQSKEFTEKAKELSDLLEGILLWVSKDRKKKGLVKSQQRC